MSNYPYVNLINSPQVSRLREGGRMPPFVSVFMKGNLVKNTANFASSVLVQGSVK
jgi:hypothetical protein